MSFASLPFELLVSIYRLNVYEPYNEDLAIPEPLQDTIAASQVCHHWRSVIVSAPELWRSFIDPYHPCSSWRDLLLKRSEPLSIEFMDTRFALDSERYRFYDIHRQMQSGMPLRLYKYDIRFRYPLVTPVPSSAWPSGPDSWPQLRYLYLHFYPLASIPHKFPGSATPILKCLDLRRCSMPDWYELGSIAQTLTTLKLSKPPLSSRICPNRWIEIIRDLPHLEILDLSCVMEARCYHSISNNNIATLSVKEFFLADVVHSCALFLNQVNLSLKCTRSEIICYWDSEEDDTKAVLLHAKRFLSQILISHYLHLVISPSSITIGSGFSGPLRYSSQEIRSLSSNYSNKFFLGLLPHIYDPPVIPTIFSGLLDLVQPLSSSTDIIQSLILSRDIDDLPDPFFDFFIHCQNVRAMLGVTPLWWKRFYSRLLPTADGITSDTTEPLFPKLQWLDFDKRVYSSARPQSASLISVDEVKALCTHRESIGIPLRWSWTGEGESQDKDWDGEVEEAGMEWDGLEEMAREESEEEEEWAEEDEQECQIEEEPE